MILRIIAILVLSIWVSSVSEAKCVKKSYSEAIVRVIVEGGVMSDETICHAPRKGTGFFIDNKGHILTVAHTFLSCSTKRPYGTWKKPPNIKIETFDSNLDTNPETVLIYADEQTDLALLRANIKKKNSNCLSLAKPHTLQSDKSGKVKYSALVLGKEHDKPVYRKVLVDSIFNPGTLHNGLIGISVRDTSNGASGAPVFDEKSMVAALIKEGFDSTDTAKIAVPISYGAPLFMMCGVSYPSTEVQEVIDELSQELLDFSSVKYLGHSDSLILTGRKRLKTGQSPEYARAEISYDVKYGDKKVTDNFPSLIYGQILKIKKDPKKIRIKFGKVLTKIKEDAANRGVNPNKINKIFEQQNVNKTVILSVKIEVGFKGRDKNRIHFSKEIPLDI